MSQRKLREMWEEYEQIEKSGAGRNDRCREIEIEIHQYQKMIGASPYDFDKRWIKKQSMAESTLSGPPPADALPPTDFTTVPQNNFTLEQAKEIIGENDFAILEDCIRHAEAWAICAAAIADKVNPSNQNNPARRGQVMNFARQDFNERKEKA